MRKTVLFIGLFLLGCCHEITLLGEHELKKIGPVIDIHAHVFHANDLAIEGVFEENDIPRPLAKVLTELILLRNDPANPILKYKKFKYRTIPPENLDELVVDSINFVGSRSGNDSLYKTLLKSLQIDFSQILTRRLLKHSPLIGTVRRHIQWVLLLTQEDPNDVSEAYETTYWKQLEQGDWGVMLYTPAMMDMSHFYAGKGPKNSYPSQVESMKKLTLAKKGRMHPFIAYNIETERLERANLAHTDTLTPYTKMIQKAILEDGFLGIKLYPAQGYRPIENETIYQENHPRGRRPCFAHPLEHLTKREQTQAAHHYDKILEDLYTWCEDQDVPIVAHCQKSSAGAGSFLYGQCYKHGDPDHWTKVLVKHPKLRLNLMHFGGSSNLAKRKQTSWAEKICKLMQGSSHVFADTGAHGITDNREERLAFFSQLSRLNSKYPKLKNRLMFGSDWPMIARSVKEHNLYIHRYISAYFNQLGRSVVDTKKFASQNALRFLGLLPTDSHHWSLKAFTRLKTYYKKYGLPTPKWLTMKVQ